MIHYPFLSGSLCRKISVEVVLGYPIQLRWLASAPASQVLRICSLYPVFLPDNTFNICFLHGPATEPASLVRLATRGRDTRIPKSVNSLVILGLA